MFKNYFTIAIRNLLKQKVYPVINIGGLSVGLASFILILLYVQHEFSYDRFHDNFDQVYRVYPVAGSKGMEVRPVVPDTWPGVIQADHETRSFFTALRQAQGPPFDRLRVRSECC